MQIESLLALKRELRAGQFTWPGGYPKFFVTQDGEVLSFGAVRAEWRQVVAAWLELDRSVCADWRVTGCDINWEDGAMVCSHSGERIESAYAEAEVMDAKAPDYQRGDAEIAVDFARSALSDFPK